MALTRASLNTPVTWASSGTKTLSFTAVPAGSFLAIVASAGDGAETFLNPTSGWNLLGSTPGGADFKTVVYYKIADGSETSFSIDASTTTGNMCGVKVTGFTGTATIEDSDELETNVTGAAVTSLGPISGDNVSSDAMALVFYGSDRWDTLETSRSYTNSFTELVAATASGSRAGAWIAGKTLSGAGPNSTTFSCSDTGDQIYAAIVIVGDVTGAGSQTITATGIASDEAAGSPTISAGAVTVSPGGIASAETLGDAAITAGTVTLSPSSVTTGEALGDATVVAGAVSVLPPSIDSEEAFGDATLSGGTAGITATGIASAEAFGDAVLTAGAVTLAPTSIASDEALGDAAIVAVGLQIAPGGIASDETFGDLTLTAGTVSLSPGGIASAEAFGDTVITAPGTQLVPTAIASVEAFGLPTLDIGPVVISPAGIGSAEAFGTAGITGPQLAVGRLHADARVLPALRAAASVGAALVAEGRVLPALRARGRING